MASELLTAPTWNPDSTVAAKQRVLNWEPKSQASCVRNTLDCYFEMSSGAALKVITTSKRPALIKTGTPRVESRLLELWNHLPTDVVHTLLAAAHPSESPELDEEQWGPDRSLADYADDVAWHARADRRRTKETIDRSVSLTVAAASLRTPVVELLRALASEELSFLAEGSQVWLPLWQFADDGSVLPGVPDISRSFPGTAVALDAFMVEKREDLDGRSFADLLASGEGKAVVSIVERLNTLP